MWRRSLKARRRVGGRRAFPKSYRPRMNRAGFRPREEPLRHRSRLASQKSAVRRALVSRLRRRSFLLFPSQVSSRQLAPQPRFRNAPLPRDGRTRDAESLSRFFQTQAAEESKLYDANLMLVDFG